MTQLLEVSRVEVEYRFPRRHLVSVDVDALHFVLTMLCRRSRMRRNRQRWHPRQRRSAGFHSDGRSDWDRLSTPRSDVGVGCITGSRPSRKLRQQVQERPGRRAGVACSGVGHQAQDCAGAPGLWWIDRSIDR